MSEHPAVVFLLEALDRAEQEADRLHTELWWVGMVDRIEVYDTDGRRVPEIAVHSQGELRLIPTTEAIKRALLVGNPTDLTRRARLARETLAEHGRSAAGDGNGFRYHDECRTCCGPAPHLTGVWPVAYPCNTVLFLAEAWGWGQP